MQPTSYPKLRKLLTYIREARETPGSLVDVFPQVFDQLIDEIKCVVEPAPSCPWPVSDPPASNQLREAYTVGYKDGRAANHIESGELGCTKQQLNKEFYLGRRAGWYEAKADSTSYVGNKPYTPPITQPDVKHWHGESPTIMFTAPDKWPWEKC